MMRRRTSARRWRLAVAAVLVSACGAGGADPSNDSYEPTGYRREPTPNVAAYSLPDLSNGDAEFTLQAAPGEILVVYFGYTNCQDFCPTTLSDLRIATRRLDDGLADRIDVAMATVDPDRDLPVLADYVASFFPDGHALGTADPSVLGAVAAPLGVAFDAPADAHGDVDVAHSTSLYAIDDRGDLALTWQFGTTIDDLAADLTYLLRASSG